MPPSEAEPLWSEAEPRSCQSPQMATDAPEVPGHYSPPNCPWCGEPLRFDCTAEDAVAQSWSVPVFECRTHGSLYLTPEGLRREPPDRRLVI